MYICYGYLLEKEKLNPKDDTDSQNIFLQRFNWTETLTTKSGKQAVEEIRVENYDVLARYRTDAGWTRISRWSWQQKMTKLNTTKAYQCQSTWMKSYLPSQLRCTNMGLGQYCLFQSTQVPFWHKQNSTGNYIFLWISGSWALWLQMITLILIILTELCKMQHNIWQRSLSPATSIASRLIAVCRMRTNGQWTCSYSVLPAERLPTKDLHKFSADLCLPSQASCASAWNQLLMLTNVLKTWMILQLQPKMLKILQGTIGQSSSAFARQNWNW